MAEIKQIGVVGAGQMGRGIAQVAAQTGYQVYIYDVFPQSLESWMEFIKSQLDKGILKSKWDAAHVEETLGRLDLCGDLKELAEVDLVIEAASESRVLKFELFRDLDRVIKPEAILASNASSISITEIAANTS